MVRVELVVTSSLCWRSADRARIFNISDSSCETVYGQEFRVCSLSSEKLSFSTLSRGLPLINKGSQIWVSIMLYVFLKSAISNVKVCSPNTSSWNSVIKVPPGCGDAGGGGLDVGGEGEIASQVSPLISRWMVRISGSGHQEQLDHHAPASNTT